MINFKMVLISKQTSLIVSVFIVRVLHQRHSVKLPLANFVQWVAHMLPYAYTQYFIDTMNKIQLHI